MKRMQLYLDHDLWKALHIRSRQFLENPLTL